MGDATNESQLGNDSLHTSEANKLLRVGGGTLPAAFREVETTTLGALPPQAIVAVATVLSIGAVAALITFIILCFLRPDAANIVIPLLISAIGPLLVKAYVDNQAKKHTDESVK